MRERSSTWPPWAHMSSLLHPAPTGKKKRAVYGGLNRQSAGGPSGRHAAIHDLVARATVPRPLV